ncbi:MAG TPA: GNAT family N-acetyltransferase [Burkholderiales bacterium]|nr:GNAT family N-acetyltransferase [Burkholderiales bacterium]
MIYLNEVTTMDMSVPVIIREASAADLPAILGLYAQPDLDDGDVLPLAQAQQILARFKRYPDYRLYVAADGDEIVGSLALLVMDNLGHLGAPSGVVEDVVVEPSRQGEGIGRRMMVFALERCRDRRCYKLALSSNLTRERAHRFYESLGFEKHGYSFRVEL